jgi:peroxiredoxin
MPALEARLADFQTAGAAILGISADSVYSHDAWAAHHSLSFPLLSDIHRNVCRAYGVHNTERNCAKRSVFIVDNEGTVRFKEEYAPGQLPDPETLLGALRTLGT